MIAERALRPAIIGLSRRGWRGRVEPRALNRNAFRLAALAVVLHFFLSSTLLYIIGIPYNIPGGNPLVKFHPSTYIVMLAALSALREQGGVRQSLHRVFDLAPSYVIFLVAMLICCIYATISVGMTGAAVFIENYVSAGLLAYALETSGPGARRSLGRLLLLLCLANAIVAVGESLTHIHVVPPYLGATAFVEEPGEFRSTAGFDHPLTGAAVIMMALLAMPSLGLPSFVVGLSFPILFLGLMVFGGRTAMAVSLLALFVVTTAMIVRGLVVRRLQPQLVAGVLLAVSVLPPAAYALVNYTPIGERLVSHLYVDNSASVRSIQWRALDQISLRDALFGLPEDRIPALVFTMNLDDAISDIENPWLLTFLKIGALGCVIFLAGLIPFLIRLWRLSALWGRTLLVCGLVIISSANTLGVKSDILFMLTAFIMTTGGYGLRNRLAGGASSLAAPVSPHGAAIPPPATRLRLEPVRFRSSAP